MFTVALTGGIGCGKSEATKIFAKLGVPIVDLDIISHQLTAANQPLVDTIASAFGHEYITEKGALNRAQMRQLIFNNHEARNQLNAILHPAIYQEAVRQIQAQEQAPYTILAIPLLDKDTLYASVIDRVLVIDCDENTQIERVKLRSKLNQTEIKHIIQAQAPRQERLSMADDIIENCGNVTELRQKIESLHKKYIKTCIVSKTIS